VSGRLKLRRGVVVSVEPLEVEVGGERRRAWADKSLLGEMREGDEVVVNVAAVDLGLGSGGFDVVHVNLTRGLEGGAENGAHVMKLNYTSLQHPVEPVERSNSELFPSIAGQRKGTAGGEEGGVPVLVLPLHGHLPPAAWAAAQAAPGLRLGYVQCGGGSLPGAMSRDVQELRDRGLLAGHITVAPAYGGDHEAMSMVGALDAAATTLGWGAILVGPGPGIVGSDTAYGHGGMAALDNAHAALSLRLPALLSPRLSSSDPRDRHRGVSHHTRSVLDLLLAPVTVAVPEGEQAIGLALSEAAAGRHTLCSAPAALGDYAASGLPTRTMGRDLQDDRLFFAAPLAAGNLLAARSLAGQGL
jgi:Protein of unknown function (DUF3866)